MQNSHMSSNIIRRQKSIKTYFSATIPHLANLACLCHLVQVDIFGKRAVIGRMPILRIGDDGECLLVDVEKTIQYRHQILARLTGTAVAQCQRARDKVVLHVDNDERRCRIQRLRIAKKILNPKCFQKQFFKELNCFKKNSAEKTQ